MRALSFLMDNDRFAVDVSLVQEYARNMTVTPVLAAPDSMIGISNLKGKVITILSLAVLLGRRKDIYEEEVSDTYSAVIFKSFTSGEDQMGLKIDKPLGLIEIDNDGVSHPSKTIEPEESFCISGVAEAEGEFYRIIDFYSIVEMFKSDGEESADTAENGGADDEK